jgi:hypothetical protein
VYVKTFHVRFSFISYFSRNGKLHGNVRNISELYISLTNEALQGGIANLVWTSLKCAHEFCLKVPPHR